MSDEAHLADEATLKAGQEETVDGLPVLAEVRAIERASRRSHCPPFRPPLRPRPGLSRAQRRWRSSGAVAPASSPDGSARRGARSTCCRSSAAGRSSSTCTCSASPASERRPGRPGSARGPGRGSPALAFRLPSRGGLDRPGAPAAGASCTDSCIAGRRRSWCGSPSSRGRGAVRRSGAATRAAAEYGIERMRAALGSIRTSSAFHERFRFDPLIGAAVRADPGLRIGGRPEPFEALTWAICEQLIEYERAAEIQRRLAARLGAAASAPGCATRPPRRDRRQAPALLAVDRPLAGPRDRARPCGPRGRAGPGRPGRPGPRARLAAAAGDPRDRQLDGADARAHRSGAARSAARRRPRLHEARRPPADRRSGARATEERGRGVLRPLRALGAARRVPTRCAAARAGAALRIAA